MRLIDADALKTAIDNGWKPDMMVSEIWDIIDEQPTIEAEPVRQWVDINDTKPSEARNYLVCAVEAGKFNHFTWAYYKKTQERFVLVGRQAHWKVTHWMPFPEPPKEVTP